MITDGKLDNFTIIQVNKVICNRITSKTANGKEPKKIIIILELDILVPGKEVPNDESIGRFQYLTLSD